MGSYYNNVKLKPDPNQESPFKVIYFLPQMKLNFYIKPTFLFPKFGWVLWEELNIMSSCTPTKYSGNQFVGALLFPPFIHFYWTLSPLWRRSPSCLGLCSDLRIHHIFLSCHGTQWGQEKLHLEAGRHPIETDTVWKNKQFNFIHHKEKITWDRHLVFDFSSVIEWA